MIKTPIEAHKLWELWAAADVLDEKAKQLRFEAARLEEEAERISERAAEILDGAL